MIRIQYVGEKATQMPESKTYVHPVPRRFRMRSMIDTKAAPIVQRMRLFYVVLRQEKMAEPRQVGQHARML